MTRALLRSLDQWRLHQAPAIPQVRQVQLQVGDFTCVEPDALLISFEVAVRGSWLGGAALVIERVPLVGRCVRCAATYSPAAVNGYRSPCCDHPMEEIVSGRELKIGRIDYDFEPSPSTPSSLT